MATKKTIADQRAMTARRSKSRNSRAAAARSDALSSVHETAADMHAAGVMSRTTMRQFDKLCLKPIGDMPPAEIVAIRRAAAVSQPVFAAYLNVAKTTVSQWERGEKRPDGAARKLMDLVRRKGLQALA
jgi:putative transcriptional regulator